MEQSRYRIVEDGLTGAEVVGLLAFHLEEMLSRSPADKVHAMPVERLRENDVTFYAAWSGEELAAVGALKQIDGQRGEIKSMRAAPAYRSKGAGKAILLHLMEEARRRGYTWLGLETGRTEDFAPARSLYARHGFVECEAFGEYRSDEFSICLSRTL